VRFELRLFLIAALSLAACGDSSSDGTFGPVGDASDASTSDADAGGLDAACANPVQHGGGCATEGSRACGYRRSCTDVLYRTTVTCTCNASRWSCGSCPTCNVDQRAPGCGIGQTCDALDLRQCDGTTVTVDATCTCGFADILWNCDNGETVHRCGDAGADAQPESASFDGSSESGGASGE
jgi:hypothetical protein